MSSPTSAFFFVCFLFGRIGQNKTLGGNPFASGTFCFEHELPFYQNLPHSAGTRKEGKWQPVSPGRPDDGGDDKRRKKDYYNCKRKESARAPALREDGEMIEQGED